MAKKILSESEKYENIRNNFNKVISYYLWLMLEDIYKYSKVVHNGYLISEELMFKFNEIAHPMDTLGEFEKYMVKSLIDIDKNKSFK